MYKLRYIILCNMITLKVFNLLRPNTQRNGKEKKLSINFWVSNSWVCPS